MLEEIINIIKEWCLKYKTTKRFVYQSEVEINHQNNNGYLQFIVDDTNTHTVNDNETITTTLDIYVLDFVKEDNKDNILKAQSKCYDAILRIIYQIENDNKYKHIIHINNYDILTLSHFTDDNCSGVKVTLSLIVPLPIDNCTINEYFNDIPYLEPLDDKVIDIKSNPSLKNELVLKPIKIPFNK